MGFKAIYLKEHYAEDVSRIDSRFIIIYDQVEENFFYYGTRSLTPTDKYEDYAGYYHYSRLDHFTTFLTRALGNLDNKITFEMHDVVIDKTEYDDLSFTNMLNRLTTHTEIFAYDALSVNRSELFGWLNALIQHKKDIIQQY